MSRVADPKAKITLLRAAEAIFADKGLSGAKVEEIARHAGLSKGAFYLHFESKDAVFRQLVESFLARCKSFFAPPSAYRELPKDAAQLLEFNLQRDVQIYEFLWQNRAFLRILAGCQGPCDYLVLAFRTEIAATTREWVDHWRKVGIFREDVDADLAATLIGGAYHELSLRMLAEEKRPPLDTWLRFAVDTFFRAYGTPQALKAVDMRNPSVTQYIEARVTSVRPARAPQRRAEGHLVRGRRS